MGDAKSWNKTRVSNLVRRGSGVYYAQVKIRGKVYRRSLETDKLKIAQLKLAKKLMEIRASAEGAESFTGNFKTLRSAFDALLTRKVPEVEKGSATYYRNMVVRLCDELPVDVDAERLRVESLFQWWVAARKAVEVGDLSGNYANLQLAWLKDALELQVSAGERVSNPVRAYKRVRVIQKDLELPSMDDFRRVVEQVRSRGAWTSEESADLIEWLAYSGMRLREVSRLTWEDVGEDEILVRGVVLEGAGQKRGTKSGKSRRVPINPALRELIDRRFSPGVSGELFSVKRPIAALKTACAALGVSHLCCHDLRHLFATVCIESGVDIPTVSKWLGHQDGGALAMKTYGHLRDEHSKRAAQKVSFG